MCFQVGKVPASGIARGHFEVEAEEAVRALLVYFDGVGSEPGVFVGEFFERVPAGGADKNVVFGGRARTR